MELLNAVVIILCAFAAAMLWVVLSQTRRLSRLKLKFGEHSEFEVELQMLVQQEVRRVNSIRLRELAKLDQLLIDIWEREGAKLLTGKQSSDSLREISESVARLEVEWVTAEETEKVDTALALREIYWLWLHRAREHFASSTPYQEVKAHV